MSLSTKYVKDLKKGDKMSVSRDSGLGLNAGSTAPQVPGATSVEPDPLGSVRQIEREVVDCVPEDYAPGFFSVSWKSTDEEGNEVVQRSTHHGLDLWTIASGAEAKRDESIYEGLVPDKGEAPPVAVSVDDTVAKGVDAKK